MTWSEVRIFISCWLFLLKVLLMIFRFSMVAFSGEVVSFSAMFIFWGKSVLFQARSRRTEGSRGTGRLGSGVRGVRNMISGRMRLRIKEEAELGKQVESSELL